MAGFPNNQETPSSSNISQLPIAGPRSTPAEISEHYMRLLQGVPQPSYPGLHDDEAALSMAATTMPATNVIGFWSEDEHKLFVIGLKIYGRGNNQGISNIVTTRTAIQVHHHTEKFFNRVVVAQPTRRRILDINSVDSESLMDLQARGLISPSHVIDYIFALAVEDEQANHQGQDQEMDSTFSFPDDDEVARFLGLQ